MVIWSGLGFIIPIVVIACFLGGHLIMEDGWSGNTWAQAGSMLLAAIATFAVDKTLLSKRTDTTLMNKETGEDVILRKNDSLFFVPFRFWPFILIALAAVILYFGMTGAK